MQRTAIKRSTVSYRYSNPAPESLPTHSCRPRCCDFCERRGTADKPLEKWFARKGCDDPTAYQLTGGQVHAFWMHNECTLDFMLNGDDCTEMFQAGASL